MENNTNYASEIDLSKVKQKMRGYVSGFGVSVFNAVLFIKRNIVILALLFVVGAGLGTYLDMNSKEFKHKVIVIPNFNSIDYLYDQVDKIESKLKKGDKDFIKSIGIKDPKIFNGIEIEPVVDIYDFLTQSGADSDHEEHKVELFRIISDNADVSKVLKENVTSRNYRYHQITISTSKETERAEVVDPILNLLNANPYLEQMRLESVNNLNLKVKENDSIIKQINKVVEGYSVSGSGSSASMLYYNNSTDLTQLLGLKDRLIKEQGTNRILNIDFQKVIKDIGVVSNVAETGGLHGKLKLIFPIFFIGIFLVIVWFRKFYKYHAEKMA